MMIRQPTETRSESPTPGTTSLTPPTNPLKRKEPVDDEKVPISPKALAVAVAASLPQGEYETGRVTCEVCGGSISFRDEETGVFTVELWEAHRLTCVTSLPTTGGLVVHTPESTARALANPPAKRRRAKRTEEERIDYLRADPYVAQFEAYRVLCASCDKWIRLRPNSTYCSIPWDAHRKSCLAKKITNKDVYALEERNTLFAKDPDVRKFDAERVLCNICDRWLSLNPDDHQQAVQNWLHHRGSCQKMVAAVKPSPPDRPALVTLSAPPAHSGSSSRVKDESPPAHRERNSFDPPLNGVKAEFYYASSPTPFHDLNPANYAPAHESRRRNAEQRAATLRADELIGEVEPNRVFCSLCQKWVQLRQDSSYCAYPWLQHRGKCLARHQRRAQKAADIAELKARKYPVPQEEDELVSDTANDPATGSADEPESEEGVSEEVRKSKKARRMERLPRQHYHLHHVSINGGGGGHNGDLERHASYHRPLQTPLQSAQRHRALRPATRRVPSTGMHHDYRVSSRNGGVEYHSGSGHGSRAGFSAPQQCDEDADVDAEGELEGDDVTMDDVRSRPVVHHKSPRHSWPKTFADLDSPNGRKSFIFSSVDYLFATTYEKSDDMSISTLLTYLNAAMPQDKHEDFDTSEVIKAAAALQERGRIVLEGDMLRLID